MRALTPASPTGSLEMTRSNNRRKPTNPVSVEPGPAQIVADGIVRRELAGRTNAIVSQSLEVPSCHVGIGLGWCMRMIGDRWGVTDEETARWYPCDGVVPNPVLQAWRGVTVRAGAERVWPWVAQIRLAPYSYDWIDNLGRSSPQALRGLPEPRVGEPFTTALRGRRFGRIVAVERGEHLTGTIMGAVMSYVLVPANHGLQTRLLLKVVTAGGRMIAPLLSVGDLIMARRQLLNLAALAERTAAS